MPDTYVNPEIWESISMIFLYYFFDLQSIYQFFLK